MLRGRQKEYPTDLLGESFGDFLVLRRDDIYRDRYRCICICGKIRIFTKADLLKATMCSECKLKEKYIGSKFKYLVVLSSTDSINTKRGIRWLCRCELCGGRTKIDSRALGKQKSCGCARSTHCADKSKDKNPNYRGYKDISMSFWKQIVQSGRVRNLEFDITIEYIWNLLEKQNRKCALTGVDLTLPIKYLDPCKTASLDRIDSKRGYIKGNVQWVHKQINILKMDNDESKFIGMCRKIARHADSVYPDEVMI